MNGLCRSPSASASAEARRVGAGVPGRGFDGGEGGDDARGEGGHWAHTGPESAAPHHSMAGQLRGKRTARRHGRAGREVVFRPPVRRDFAADRLASPSPFSDLKSIRRLDVLEPAPAQYFVRRPSYPWLVVGTVCIGTFIGQVDGSIVQLALPSLETAFDAPLDAVSWVALGYMLAFACVLPVFARLAEIAGRKTLYLSGFALFGLWSALCGCRSLPRRSSASASCRARAALCSAPTASSSWSRPPVRRGGARLWASWRRRRRSA